MFKLSSHAQTQFSCSTLEFDTKISLSFELSFCKIIMDYGIWIHVPKMICYRRAPESRQFCSASMDAGCPLQ